MAPFHLSKVLPIAIAILLALKHNPKHTTSKKLGHKYIVLDEFVSESVEQDLRRMYETVGEFASSKADFSSKQYVEIGEGYPPTSNGRYNVFIVHHVSSRFIFLDVFQIPN